MVPFQGTSPDGIKLAWQAYPDVRYERMSVYDDLSVLMPQPQEGWDMIVASEVIEHLYSPKLFLRNMCECLHPGGSLIFTTPYHGYLKNLAISLLNRWDDHFTTDWEGGHIKFFSKPSLQDFLESSGFRCPRFRGTWSFPLLWKSMVVVAEKR